MYMYLVSAAHVLYIKTFVLPEYSFIQRPKSSNMILGCKHVASFVGQLALLYQNCKASNQKRRRPASPLIHGNLQVLHHLSLDTFTSSLSHYTNTC